jgi:hypothetical protein
MKADTVAIGLRIGQAPDPAFFISWTRMLLHGLRPGDRVLAPTVGRPHSCACNCLVQRFLSTDCDALLFVDDDMVFEPGDVAALCATVSEHGVLSALYTTRRAPVRPVVLHRCADGYAPRPVKDCVGVVTCDVVGLGFTLVSRAVVEAAANSRGADGVFVWDNVMGEDGHFCQQAQAAGFSVGVNCAVRVGHRVTHTSRWVPDEAGGGVVEMALDNFGIGSE